MIATVESNCTTGEVKYFDENGIEINLETALLEIESRNNVEVAVATSPEEITGPEKVTGPEEITTVSTEILN
jgi:NADPH-dependent 2,4-dienoyl-CoA reductase/sulfur reductase-like enzyme